MPIYEYRCDNGHQFEVLQKISDPPVTTCETCSATVARVFNPVAVHFKGSGFYNTDYGTAKRKRESDAKESAKKKTEKKDSGSTSSSSSDSSSSTSKSSESSKPAKTSTAKT